MGDKKQDILSVSLRLTQQGGEHYIPVKEEDLIAIREIVYNNFRSLVPQLSPKFISNFTVGYKINRNRLAHEIGLKIVNITRNKDFSEYFYNYRDDKPEKYMRSVVIPNINYKIEF